MPTRSLRRLPVVASLLALLLLVSASLAPTASAVTKDTEAERYISKITPYIRTTDKGVRYFDESEARKNKADDLTLEIGNNFNLISQEHEAARNGVGKDRVSLPIWGNWCGPGHSGPGAPTDLLDTACMHHDKCYGKKGYFSCSCDQQLIDEIWRNFWKMKAAEKAMAVAVATYFDESPCNPFA